MRVKNVSKKNIIRSPLRAALSKKKKRPGCFQIASDYKPAGDQPRAIQSLCKALKQGEKWQTLMGVTGSGKTFTMACVMAQMNRPTLVLAPNKTLAAQLFAEFKEIFPANAVEYFVSYYDYYQPEAYVPSTDTYIEKDTAINDQIDRMRHRATMALFDRQDVLIVSSVSCLYGLGSPEAYEDLIVRLHVNQHLKRDELLKALVAVHYQRKDFDFHRGTFRVRGDTVEVFPSYEEDYAFRIEFFGDHIDFIGQVDPLRGRTLKTLGEVSIYPGSHYVSTEEKNKGAIKSIRQELKQTTASLLKAGKKTECDRLKRRTLYDLEMIAEMGTCPGIENYSRHFTGRLPGDPPPTLLEYFPSDFLMFVDESHISIPQAGGMYRGDRKRKQTLVDYCFRLPSALDNRPLNFKEFEDSLHQVVCVSATPGEYEIQKSRAVVVEQIIRPTGLLDPEVFIRKTRGQIENLFKEITHRTKKKERVLITTLTKKMAESLTAYLQEKKVRARYLHSDIKTIERMELIRDLRLGVFDVLVGINLLREGLDLPEVSLVAVMDADKEGFLRSKTSLIQIIGRAARHINGQVILYADTKTYSIGEAVKETNRRRKLQKAFNLKHGIQPRSVKKAPPKGLMEIYNFEEDDFLKEDVKTTNKSLRNISGQIQKLKEQMKQASEDLDFEKAVRLRDKIKRLQIRDLSTT